MTTEKITLSDALSNVEVLDVRILIKFQTKKRKTRPLPPTKQINFTQLIPIYDFRNFRCQMNSRALRRFHAPSSIKLILIQTLKIEMVLLRELQNI